jgi:endonuclease YncB( thermonuclease family)
MATYNVRDEQRRKLRFTMTVCAALALAMFAFLLAMNAHAATLNMGRCSVIDGDTFKCTSSKRQTVTRYRLMVSKKQGVDAPELKTCPGPATAAKNRLAALLAPPAIVTYYTQGKDTYGRTLVHVLARNHDKAVHSAKEHNVAKILIAEKLAIVAGGRTGWCPGTATHRRHR